MKAVDDIEDKIPTPPPSPSVEFLLGKQTTNLRGKGHSLDSEESDDEGTSHNDQAVISCKSEQKKKPRKRKRKASKEDKAFDWQYNKLTVPQSSPPRERRGIARKLTPQPIERSYSRRRDLPSSFDEVSHDLTLSDSLSSSSPLQSPSPMSSVGSPNVVSPSSTIDPITGYLNKSTAQPKSVALLPSHQQNRFGMQPNPPTKKMVPITLKSTSRKAIPKKELLINSHQYATHGTLLKTSSSTVMLQLASSGGHYPSTIVATDQQVLLRTCMYIAQRSDSPFV